jgi:hypothetical protein
MRNEEYQTHLCELGKVGKINELKLQILTKFAPRKWGSQNAVLLITHSLFCSISQMASPLFAHSKSSARIYKADDKSANFLAACSAAL